MKILITERQLKLLVEGDPEKKGTSNEYMIDQELEEVVITYDKKSGETTAKVGDWQYVGSKGRRKRGGSYWIAKGIDIGGMRNIIHKFSKNYAEFMSNNPIIDMYVGPVVTSGYRGAKRQVNAIWDQWKGDKRDLKSKDEGGVGYSRSLANPIEKIFIDNEDNPVKAKRLATDFLKQKEKEDKYMSNHQQKGAIDISLFKGGKYGDKNETIKKFLEKAKKDGDIVSFIDERGKDQPHFHIKLT